MALPRAQRIQYKRFLANLSDQPEWDFQGILILFEDFGLDPAIDDFNGPDYTSALKSASDETLEEMYRVATGSPEDAKDMEKSSDVWRDGQLRLFISHLTSEKVFTIQVSDALKSYGIHGFVAHEHLPTEQNWSESLQDALRSMQAFIAFVHPKFGDSTYCNQEVGWALGRNVPARFLRLGELPPGFASSLQSPDLHHSLGSPYVVARHIVDWLAGIKPVQEKLSSVLSAALINAVSFDHAGIIANAIVKCDSMSDADRANIGIAQGNGQVSNSFKAQNAFKPFFESKGETYPPAPF